jgi:predicted RNase H-like HicB family nuclease
MRATVDVPKIRFEVVLSANPDGWITAECPSLPGCISQGRTRKSALENIREAIQAWLEGEQEARRRGWKPVWERGSR